MPRQPVRPDVYVRFGFLGMALTFSAAIHRDDKTKNSTYAGIDGGIYERFIDETIYEQEPDETYYEFGFGHKGPDLS